MLSSFYSFLSKVAFVKRLKGFLLVFTFILPLFCCCACNRKSVDYFSYVSELRSNVFLAETEEFSLKIYTGFKESPYLADGRKRSVNPRTEIFLTALSGEKNYCAQFTHLGKTYGGDLSFDNVKSDYFYHCDVDVSALNELVVEISYGDTVVELNAVSVLKNSEESNVLSPEEILQKVCLSERERVQMMTDQNGFLGEFYIRLLHESAPYYYVGIVDRESKIYSLLLDAKSGKILAKRENA